MTAQKPQSVFLDRSARDVQGQILRPDILAAGDSILIVPFRAGVHAAASKELDRISLVLVRGMMDGLSACDGRFRISHYEEDGRSDIVVTGHIGRFEIQDGWKRYFGGKRARVIEFHGKAVGPDEELIAVFSHMVRMPYDEISEIDFLLKAGNDVGAFLCRKSAIQE